jgi:hypothetical protein
VCFWSPHKVAAWKRPALLFLSVLLITGTTILASFASASARDSWLLWLLFVTILGLSVLGFLVALRGCSNCVARIFGGI